MALNIIVRTKPVDHADIDKALCRHNEERLAKFNHSGWKIAAQQIHTEAQKHIGHKHGAGDHIMSVPVTLDGLLMDDCRAREGHSDWRRSKYYLQRLVKQPEMSVLPACYRRGLEIALETANK